MRDILFLGKFVFVPVEKVIKWVAHNTPLYSVTVAVIIFVVVAVVLAVAVAVAMVDCTFQDQTTAFLNNYNVW